MNPVVVRAAGDGSGATASGPIERVTHRVHSRRLSHERGGGTEARPARRTRRRTRLTMWMRVLFLVLAAGLGHARAAEWQWLGDATERAAPAPRPVPDALAATRIINGVPTGEYPAVAGLEIVDATTMALCTGTLV